MESVVRTLYGSRIQTALLTGKMPDIQQYTTLNEKFGIQAGQAPVEIPTLNLMTIGNKAHTSVDGAGGVSLTKFREHVSTNAALYGHMPFVLRELANDLTPAERAGYALRAQVTYNSQQYIAYYAKRFDLSTGTITSKIRTQTGNVQSFATHVPSADDLNPTPPVLQSGGVNPLENKYGIVSMVVPMVFTAAECAEMLEAARIIYGDESYAIISEVGLCTSDTKQISLPDSSFFNEAVAAQIASFIQTYYQVASSRGGINATLNIGSAEPLLVLS